jgi:hypothetical protein
MPKTDESFNAADYAPVAERIAQFYSQHPNGRIVTELISNGEREVVFRALVFRASEDGQPAATGWASERFGDGDINTVACLENTETSAVGRALANLGFTASRFRPSREEMEKAARARIRASGNGVPTDEADQFVSDASAHDTLQHRADHASDVLVLIAEAERLGMPLARAAELRSKLLTPGVTAEYIARTERALRRWLIRQHRHNSPM